jgi:hypothetical protein
MYLGYKYGSEWLTAPYDPERSALDSAEGRQPSSMRVGDRWVKIGNLGPVGAAVIMGEAVRQAQKERGAWRKMVKGGTLIAEAMSDTPLVSFAEEIGHLFTDPLRSAASIASSKAGALVPAIVAQTAQALDDRERQRDPWKPWEAAQGRIPGLREQLPAKVSGAGRTPPMTVFGTEATDTRVTRELRRLNIPLSAMDKTMDVGKRSDGTRFMLHLPMEQQQKLYRAQQRATMGRLAEVVASPEYRAAGPNGKSRMLRKEMAETHKAVLSAYKGKYGATLKALIKEQKAAEAGSPPDRSEP